MKATVERKILIVDDSPTERFFLADLLSKRGYTVVTAESGDEALSKVRSEKPSLVVMDVVSPPSGYRPPAMRGIRHAVYPVILCTSKVAESARIGPAPARRNTWSAGALQNSREIASLA